jgi:hypothetical protein
MDDSVPFCQKFVWQDHISTFSGKKKKDIYLENKPFLKNFHKTLAFLPINHVNDFSGKIYKMNMSTGLTPSYINASFPRISPLSSIITYSLNHR